MEDVGPGTILPPWLNAKYFPYCRPDVGQKPSNQPMEELGLDLYETPREDQGQNWYILSGLEVSGQTRFPSNVNAKDVKKYVQKDGNIVEEYVSLSIRWPQVIILWDRHVEILSCQNVERDCKRQHRKHSRSLPQSQILCSR